MADTPTDTVDLVALAGAVTASYVANNATSVAEVPNLIQSIYGALKGLGEAPKEQPVEEKPQGAVSVRKSLANPDRILSMIDGKPYMTLKRHLNRHGLTPAEYREKYGLPKDYPMVAPTYAAKRSELAKSIGLGRKPGAAANKAAAKPARKAPLNAALAAAKEHLGGE